MEQRYLIYRAYWYHLNGSPMPVDLFLDLVEVGLDPEELSASFFEGWTPPFDEDDYDMEDFDPECFGALDEETLNELFKLEDEEEE